MHKMHFSFKGNRQYIHGTDIFIFLENLIEGKIKLFDLRIIKKIKRQPNIKIYNYIKNNKNQKNKANVICRIVDNKDRIILFNESKKNISDRYSFDENILKKNFYLKGNIANCSFESSLHSIEILVALTKYWHQKKIKLGNWVFVRLKLNKKFKNFKIKNLKIKNINNINNKRTISEVFQNKKNIGKIYFILNDKN